MNKHMRIMISGLIFNTTCLFIRYVNYVHTTDHGSYDMLPSAVYRTIELADGWGGRILATQVYFSRSYPRHVLEIF
jgi:hypothetical protein